MKPSMLSRLLSSAVLAVSLAACNTLPPAGIQPVSPFDVHKYAGKWYEIARLDQIYERGLSQINATYALNGDGSVAVVNRGYDAASGVWKEAHGKALFNGRPDVASLKVSFFGPFYGGYHVIALDPDYRWAMVAGNDRDTLWLLARDRSLPAQVTASLLAQARQLGFDTAKLVWSQSASAEQPQP